MPIFVIDTIRPKNGGAFPVAEDSDLKGGFRSVADVTARDAIPTEQRKVGMLVYTAATDAYWKLGVGLGNGDWTAFTAGGGGSDPLPIEVFFSGEAETASTIFSREGVRSVDMSLYPATIGSLTRQVKFSVCLENSLDTTDYNVEARLFDLTHGVAITGTTFDNTAAPDRSIPTEFVSSALTVGSSAGNIRSDAPALYAVQFRGDGALGPTDRAILSNAHIKILYV